MKITTNNVPRQMQAFNDIPVSAQSDFDYLGDDDKYRYRLVQYKGNWYDVYDTIRIDSDIHPSERELYAWDSVLSESYFHGKLFKLAPDECVIVGSYVS